MGAYRLQWDMIKFALNNNIPIFMGLLEILVKMLKIMVCSNLKGFNAHVEEYVGDFIKPIRPIFYKVYKLLK